MMDLQMTQNQENILAKTIEHLLRGANAHIIVTAVDLSGASRQLRMFGTMDSPGMQFASALLMLRAAVQGFAEGCDAPRQAEMMQAAQIALGHMEAVGVTDEPMHRAGLQ